VWKEGGRYCEVDTETAFALSVIYRVEQKYQILAVTFKFDNL
jgi:hypothetical protein